jgi:RES domain-containing protein
VSVANVKAWRIFKPKHAASAFTGEGARLYGGRFNSKGIAVVYTSSSIALASLEMMVQLQASGLLSKYLLCEITFDRSLASVMDRKVLPRNWKRSPPPVEVQQVGDDWVADGESAVLQVPSAIVEEEANFLLNPHHPDFRRITIGKPHHFRFDPRLLKRR